MGIHWVMQDPEVLERRYQELFDVETGLAGELLLRDRVTLGLARAKRVNRYVLLVWLEIDVADESETATVARAVAGALRESIRPDDTVARVGSREFVVLCNDLAHQDAVGQIVRRLHNAIGRTASHAGGAEPLARIGTTLGRASQDTNDVLLRAREALKPVRRQAEVHTFS